MHSVTVALIVFACSFGGALAGMLVGARLPSPHLSAPTKHAVKLGMGMIVTLAGLVLGLLVSSAKSAFDTTDSEVKQISAKLVLLDRVLARYGPETMAARTSYGSTSSRRSTRSGRRTACTRSRSSRRAADVLESALDRVDGLSPPITSSASSSPERWRWPATSRSRGGSWSSRTSAAPFRRHFS